MIEDPIVQLISELAKSDRPTSAWLEANDSRGDPVTFAWNASASPHSMIRLLAIAQNDDIDTAAKMAIHAAAETLRREDPKNPAITELASRSQSSTASGELAHLLFGVWCVALPGIDRRNAMEAEIAARIRTVVRRPPALADIEPPPARERSSSNLGAEHLFDRIADPAQLRVLDADTVRRSSRGRVISPESFGRSGPELGGLVCERIFGTWRPRSSACTQDDRDEHWGHIEFSHPCTHPIVPKARLTVLPVVPPYYRRWTLVEVDELRRHARERRASLENRDDLCDPPEKILAEEGLSDPDALTEPGVREHRLCRVYRALLNLDRQQSRLVELGAPAQIVEEQRAKRDWWLRELVGVWRQWLDELPSGTEASWAMRALAVSHSS
jgi:hypothetical protein